MIYGMVAFYVSTLTLPLNLLVYTVITTDVTFVHKRNNSLTKSINMLCLTWPYVILNAEHCQSNLVTYYCMELEYVNT